MNAVVPSVLAADALRPYAQWRQRHDIVLFPVASPLSSW